MAVEVASFATTLVSTELLDERFDMTLDVPACNQGRRLRSPKGVQFRSAVSMRLQWEFLDYRVREISVERGSNAYPCTKDSSHSLSQISIC